MTYLPILINLATREELEKIKGIGPKRSEQIIKYREEVSDISTSEELIKASGLTPAQVEGISKTIDWSPSKKIGGYDAGTVIVTLLSIIVTIIIGISQVKLSEANSTQILYNLGITLVIFSAVSNLIELQSKRIIPLWGILAMVLLVSGIFIFSLLLIVPSTFLAPANNAASIRGFLTLLIFLNLIFYLNNGPSIYLRYQVWQGVNNQSLRIAERIYQYSYIFLPSILVYILIFLDSLFWFEELFAFWLGFTLILSSSAMLKGVSPFQFNLSKSEKKLYPFLSRDSSSEIPSEKRHRIVVLGKVYIIMGSLILTITAMKIIIL